MPKPEERPIPELAKSAFKMAQLEFQQHMNHLANQALEAMGLSPDDGWGVNVGRGVAVRNRVKVILGPPSDPRFLKRKSPK